MDGWQYLGLKPHEVRNMTPKDFDLLMEAQTERLYDVLEMASIKAMMMRAAYHSDKKNLNAQDLFKRPEDVEIEKKNIETMKQTVQKQQEWLNQFSFGKEENNG